MFVLQNVNEEGKIGVIDTRDNVVDYYSREMIIIFHEDLLIDYSNYDSLESLYEEFKKSQVEKEESAPVETFDDGGDMFATDGSQNMFGGDDMFASNTSQDMFSGDDMFASDTSQDMFGGEDMFASQPASVETPVQQQPVQSPIEASVPEKTTQVPIEEHRPQQPMQISTPQPITSNTIAENLIKSVITTFQDNLIPLNVNDFVNQNSTGFITDLYYLDMQDKIIIFNLHKYTLEQDELGIPNYCVGYIDKNTRVFREMYNSANPFFFVYRDNYVLLIKRDVKFTINRIDLKLFKTRIVGNPVKLKYAIINLLPTNQDDYYFISVISRKKGEVGFLFLIDMTLKCEYYPCMIKNEEAQNWLNENVFFRIKHSQYSFETLCACKQIMIQNLDIKKNISVKFTSDISTNGVFCIDFGKSLEETKDYVEQ